MVAAFATVTDLSDRGWSGNASDNRIARALEDASAFLRAEIGWQVYPVSDVVVSARDWTSSMRLAGPVQSIRSVTASGRSLPDSDYELDGNVLHLAAGSQRVTVTYRLGYNMAPDELIAWTCVLAADDLARAADPDDMGGARPASESLADWRVTYSKRQQEGELAIPDRVLERLRSTYGTTAYVTS